MKVRHPLPNRATRSPQPSYEQLEASLLHCPTCRVAVQVRKRLLLVLPQGDKYEYLCVHCSTTCGDKVESAPPVQWD